MTLSFTFETRPAAAPARVVFSFGGKLYPADRAAEKAVKAEGFGGAAGQVLAIPGAPAIVVAGLGKDKDKAPTLADIEAAGGALVAALNARKAASAVVPVPVKILGKIDPAEAAAALAFGAQLSAYRFDRYLTKIPKEKKPALKALRFVLPEAKAAKAAFVARDATASGVIFARDLVSEAPNVLYPGSYAEILKKELSSLGIKVTVLGRKEIRARGMGALAAVGQGSAREEKLVTMEWMKGGKSAKTLALVGKGVTFDTGGISIKPAAGMDEMKWDMGGSAAVAGAMKTLALSKAKANVVGVVALAENMPGGDACRPGDVVTSLSGQTVEILNTDAEGRLILCDALWYAQEEFAPDTVVDLATLTGAVIVALGHEYAGLFSNDDALAGALVAAGRGVGERLWRLPLDEAWDKALDSPVADIKNIAGGATGAGSAIGAHFLKRFIKPGVKWAHLDIAGTAWSDRDRPLTPKGAAGFGVRLLEKLVAERAGLQEYSRSR